MNGLTPDERRVLTLFERAASGARPCPTNGDVAALLDCGMSWAGALVARLEAIGAIRIDSRGHSRIVEIVASGRRTGLTQKPPLPNRTVRELAPRNPAARLDVHEPCFFCGARVDACGCASGRWARGQGVAA